VWLPLQTPGTATRLRINQEQLLAAMWVLTADGRSLNGVNAWIELLRCVWWLSPLAHALTLPGANGAGQLVYRWFARHRYCLSGACGLNHCRTTPHRHAAFFELP
jgi:predicted DCC family thiol-disulfide oxidoreductase YuxK